MHMTHTDTHVTLDVPVPPLLETALQIDSAARWIGLFWSPGGDAARSYDGRIERDASWYGYITLLLHPLMTTDTVVYDFGSTETTAMHWLIVDRQERQFIVLPAASARAFLRQHAADRWTPPETVTAATAARTGDPVIAMNAWLTEHFMTRMLAAETTRRAQLVATIMQRIQDARQ